MIPIEAKRAQLQRELDRRKHKEERNRLGQFPTPYPLAAAVVRAALDAMPEGAPLRFLDPAFGTGVFYSALLEESRRPIEEAVGYELDRHYGEPSRQLWAEHPLELCLSSFLDASPGPTRASLVICNPPYVRHHHLPKEQKRALQAAAAERFGARPSGLMGLYGYFLLRSLDWMEEGGVGAWLLPSELLDVNYGRALKRILLNECALVRVHRADPRQVEFEEALVSSAVLLFRRGIAPPGHRASFSFGGSVARPARLLEREQRALNPEAKWSAYAAPTPAKKIRSAGRAEQEIRLGELFTVRRGIATGANRFFILGAEEIRERGLPRASFTPILPSPRALRSDEIEADEEGNPLIEGPRFLLQVEAPMEALRTEAPALFAYLEAGVPEISGRYLCRHRSPWYAQERRDPAPLLSTYMGRPREGGRPFRFVLNRSRAIAANVYHLLYPRPALQERLRADPDLLPRIWRALNALPSATLRSAGRVYGGGLFKLEPKELAELRLPEAALE